MAFETWSGYLIFCRVRNQSGEVGKSINTHYTSPFPWFHRLAPGLPEVLLFILSINNFPAVGSLGYYVWNISSKAFKFFLGIRSIIDRLMTSGACNWTLGNQQNRFGFYLLGSKRKSITLKENRKEKSWIGTVFLFNIGRDQQCFGRIKGDIYTKTNRDE